MERIKKKLKCETLKKEISVTYFIESIKNSDGSVKKKAVQYFNCEAQDQCADKSDLMSCTCFKETRKIEMEINIL